MKLKLLIDDQYKYRLLDSVLKHTHTHTHIQKSITKVTFCALYVLFIESDRNIKEDYFFLKMTLKKSIPHHLCGFSFCVMHLPVSAAAPSKLCSFSNHLSKFCVENDWFWSIVFGLLIQQLMISLNARAIIMCNKLLIFLSIKIS